MKRRSSDKADLSSSDGVLVDKWYVPNAPEPLQRAKWPEINDSYVEFEELNRLGRFSYNKYNKETEVNNSYTYIQVDIHGCSDERFLIILF